MCVDCIRAAEEGMAQAIDQDIRRRAGPSESVMAEELALNLMDALDATRSDPGSYEDWQQSGDPVEVAPPEPEPPARRVLKVAAVIPARFASSRFPGKPLHLIAGKPMIQHVWERCVASGVFREVLVATDDDRIFQAVTGFGGTAVMTSAYAKSGTDRVAEIARAREDFTHFVNVQGDEPLIHPEMLSAVAGTFEDPEVEISTLIRPLEDTERHNPNVVKVVLARNSDALYFSRADIPHQRDEGSGFPHRYAHIGLYGYSRAAVIELACHAASPLEEIEKLEQLRALELGMKIRCLVTLHRSVGVDTPEDAARVEQLLA